MPWVYLDDQFPDHPKVARAGGDAAWLFVCGLAYCRRYDTAGAIPAGQVAKLTDRKSPSRLARTLVEVGLWENDGNHFRVHDYDEWNKPQESRSAAARKAAKARWSGHKPDPPPDAPRNANASPAHTEAHSGRNAKTDASGCPPPHTPLSTQVVSPTGGDPPPDPTDDAPKPLVRLVAEARARRVYPGQTTSEALLTSIIRDLDPQACERLRRQHKTPAEIELALDGKPKSAPASTGAVEQRRPPLTAVRDLDQLTDQPAKDRRRNHDGIATARAAMTGQPED